ncbi:hypothetical protein SDC9_155467 [bioreactor metagenome]|uniref:OmpA-like domain-containing protein n=1 Tax=bioreactor metagenome TaxID=1076179 RepID=A0A645F3G8_9ZZZZ
MVSPNFGFVVGGSINSQSYTADINKADIKYNDIALSAGLGLKFPVHISGTKFYLGIEAQYNLGLIDNFGTGNDFMNSTPCGSVGDRKNRGIEIAATISVPLGSSERPMISSDRVVYRTRIDTVYRDVEKFVYEDKPCYEIREIISYLKQGIDVHNKSVCMYNIQFDYNKAELSADSKRQVDDVIILMQNIPELIVKINGHTDNKGDKKYNQDLSEKRAKGVYDYMVKKGVDKSRLSYQGFGMDKPIADNKTEEGRSQNRRVEFEIINY